MAAVVSAISSQTVDLSTKLGLIEAAVKDGFADGQAQQELLLQAVEALEGTVEEKLAAIEEAVKAQTNSLETKIGLVEAAVKEGLADSAAAQDLIRTALESLYARRQDGGSGLGHQQPDGGFVHKAGPDRSRRQGRFHRSEGAAGNDPDGP